MDELWKDVVGYEGFYKVSNTGLVYSVPRGSTKGGIMTVPNGNKKEYRFITLCKDGKKFRTGIHRLVAEAFIPNPENKPTVNHENGNKQDNNVTNLSWATYKEQLEHSFRIGLRKKQCNIERKAVIIFPDNHYKKFENIQSLCNYINKTKSFIHHYIMTKGNRFYIMDKLIIVSNRNENYIIEDYVKPTIHDITLYDYCRLNNLNYSTVRDRKRRGDNEKDMLRETNTKFVEYNQSKKVM